MKGRALLELARLRRSSGDEAAAQALLGAALIAVEAGPTESISDREGAFASLLHEVLADPQTEAIGMIQKSPEHGLELMSLPISFDGARPPLRRRSPTVGEHNAEVFPD